VARSDPTISEREPLRAVRTQMDDHGRGGTGEPSCPIRFGDIVLLSDGSLGVAFLPDQGGELLACFALDELGDLPNPEPEREIVIANWDSIERVVGDREELPEVMQKHLEPYRRGVVIGSSQWVRGVELLEEGERARFEAGQWNEFTAEVQALLTSLFGPFDPVANESAAVPCYRVLVHLDEAWDTWRSFGPMTLDESRALVERLPETFEQPSQLRRGVYDAHARAMSKLEVYRYYAKVDERRFTRGQGES
jgi:hypothetical protein